MADYFTNFSVIVLLPQEGVEWAVRMAEAAAQNDGDALPADFPEALRESVEDWSFETEATANQAEGAGVWLHSDNGGVDAACAFIAEMLKLFGPDAYVTLQWSFDCSKPRIDAYGGGAALITAHTIETIGTKRWLDERVEKIQGSLAGPLECANQQG